MIGRLRCRKESGFTLVETLASMTIFVIVTLGVVPVMTSALTASGMSRSRTVADNAARAAMERLSGIKFYTSYDAKPTRVDVLDLYFPKASNAGLLATQSYSATAANPPLANASGGGTGVFTTTCPDLDNPACPRSIPAGHTLVFKASFVEPVTTSTPQTYRMVTPSSGYAWNVSGSDKPASDLLDVSVTDTWTYGGKSRSLSLRSIVGERTFQPATAVETTGTTPPSPPPGPSGGVRIQGEARLDYAFQGTTGFVTNATGGVCSAEPCNRSDLIFTVGHGAARVETKDVSSADVSMRYAEGRIVRSYAPGVTPPESPPPDLAYMTGSYATLQAPPAASVPLGPTQIGTFYATHPENLTNQARIYDNQLAGMKADVGSETPLAEASFQVPASPSSADVWMNNSQRDSSSIGPMHMDATMPVFFTVRGGTGPQTPNGYVRANTGALNTSTRRVQTTAFANLPGFYLYRIYAGNSGRDSYYPLGFSAFSAKVDCKSTGNPATATATAEWSVYLTLSYDTANAANGGTVRGAIRTLTLRSSGVDDVDGVLLPEGGAAWLKAQNPLIWDGNSVCCSSTSDIYLFETRDANGTLTKRGYLTDFTTLKNPPTTVSADGRRTTASVDGAIRIETASLRQYVSPIDLPDTAMTLSFGNLSCSAVDNR